MAIELPEKLQPLFDPYRYKALHGGRGGAKSHSIAQTLVIMAAQRPLRILCCREVQNSIQASVKQILDDKIELLVKQGYLERGFYGSTNYEITNKMGSQFLFKGLRTNADSVKSMEGIDIVWVEEANTVSQTSLTLLIPTIRAPGSEIWFSWNRRHKKDPVDNMFLGEDGAPPNSLIIRINYMDNPWFPEVLMDELLWDKGRDHDKYLHVWEGEPIQRSEAKVFQNWKIEDIDDQIPFDCPPRLGADWGFSTDPTTLVECYIFGRTLYFRREAYKVKCEIDETPSLFAGSDWQEPKRWKNAFSHTGLPSVRKGHMIVADSARPETISYMKKRGFNIRRAIKGAKSVEEGIEFMKSYDIIVHPSCTHVQDELTHYSYKEDPLTDEVLPELADKHNHLIDACRYAVEQARKKLRGTIAVTGAEAVTAK